MADLAVSEHTLYKLTVFLCDTLTGNTVVYVCCGCFGRTCGSLLMKPLDVLSHPATKYQVLLKKNNMNKYKNITPAFIREIF